MISKTENKPIITIKDLHKSFGENHVLGNTSKAIDYLITSKNVVFEKEVQFFTDLENAIKKVERKRIKT